MSTPLDCPSISTIRTSILGEKCSGRISPWRIPPHDFPGAHETHPGEAPENPRRQITPDAGNPKSAHSSPKNRTDRFLDPIDIPSSQHLPTPYPLFYPEPLPTF